MDNRKKRYHLVGYLVGITISLVCLGVLFYPGNDLLSAPGPMNAGHENLACDACHVDARGSLRQRLQANVQYLIGNRNSTVVLGNKTVGNSDCLACHSRPDDRHPVYRFLEPRYSKTRKTIQAQFCVGCHREHSGKRVSQASGFCIHCHDDLSLRKDPLDVSHKQLINEKRWSSCLGCHDFHGNHIFKEKQHLSEAHAESDIMDYLSAGSSPYPDDLRYPALKERPDE